MDQGVIQNVKVHYRRQLLHRMLLCADSGKDYVIDLLSAIHILARAWEQVQATTVQKCFHHAGFEAHDPIAHEEAGTADEEADTILNQIVPSAPFSRQDYEDIDANVCSCREGSIEEIIAEVQAEDHSSSSDECEDPVPSAVPDSAARNAVALLLQYFERQ
ncbi:uncharacterized protein LOC144112440 [Amblyomma americanum]